MRSAGMLVCHWIHQVALSLWLGGLLALGAVAAPAAFAAARAHGHTQWSDELYRFAGEIAGSAFGRFQPIAVAAALVAAACGIAYGRLAGLCRVRLAVRAILTLLAGLVNAWLGFGLYPQMVAAREAGRMEEFGDMHRIFSGASLAVVVLLLGVHALTGWLHLARPERGAHQAGPDGPA